MEKDGNIKWEIAYKYIEAYEDGCRKQGTGRRHFRKVIITIVILINLIMMMVSNNEIVDIRRTDDEHDINMNIL